MELDTVVCGDYLDVMADMADGCVDAVITDPPYSMTDILFDRMDVSEQWEIDLLRVVQNNGYLATFANFIMAARIGLSWKIRFTGFWLKASGIVRTHSAKKPMSKSEPYFVFAHPRHETRNLVWNEILVPGKPYRKVQYKKKMRVYVTSQGTQRGEDSLARASTSNWTRDGYVFENNGWRKQTDVIMAGGKSHMAHSERTSHPTQKPESAMSVLVKWLTNPGDLIFDPFIGSGTTAVAALKLGRRFYGCDINSEYIDIANERIERARAEMAQMEMNL